MGAKILLDGRDTQSPLNMNLVIGLDLQYLIMLIQIGHAQPIKYLVQCYQ